MMISAIAEFFVLLASFTSDRVMFPSPYGEMFEKGTDVDEEVPSEVLRFHPLAGKCLKKLLTQCGGTEVTTRVSIPLRGNV